MTQADDEPEAALVYVKQGNAFLGSLDYEEAFRLAGEFGWEVFSAAQDTPMAFRETIKSLIRTVRPSWIDVIPLGRGVVRETLSDPSDPDPDAWQCFVIAELDGDQDATVQWWDEVATDARIEGGLRRLGAGRAAERKCLEREQEILVGTGVYPEWVGFDDNRAGYDVQSWRPLAGGGFRPHFIEVKSSKGGDRVYLSRREWELATSRPSYWELQIWIGDRPEPVVVDHAEVARHVPLPQGAGRWESVLMPIGALAGDAQGGNAG